MLPTPAAFPALLAGIPGVFQTATATPAVISISTTPNTAGSVTVILNWDGRNNGNDVYVSASGTFPNCPQVPLSAVTVSCVAAPQGNCTVTTPTPLSAGQLLVASRVKAKRSNDLTLAYSFTDSWSYAAKICTGLTVTYTLQ